MTAEDTTYRYGLGQQVRFEPKFALQSASSDYEIIGFLPVENDNKRQYRIKNATENFERIAEEYRLADID